MFKCYLVRVSTLFLQIDARLQAIQMLSIHKMIRIFNNKNQQDFSRNEENKSQLFNSPMANPGFSSLLQIQNLQKTYRELCGHVSLSPP